MAKATKKKKAPPKRPANDATDIEAKRAKAYHQMENSVCEIARMGELAMDCFDDPDSGKFIFAVGHLEWMLQRFRQRYYAMEFPPEN
jgi:hypothetical protein